MHPVLPIVLKSTYILKSKIIRVEFGVVIFAIPDFSTEFYGVATLKTGGKKKRHFHDNRPPHRFSGQTRMVSANYSLIS